MVSISTDFCKHIFHRIFSLFPIFLSLWRLWYAFFYNKYNFILKNDSNVFKTIYKQNLWNDKESVSGTGSTIIATATIRKILPIIWEKYNIKSMLDIPCGDYNWMSKIDKTAVSYIGGDIVKEIIDNNRNKYSAKNIIFNIYDITQDDLPQVDLIFCKDCLQHLSFSSVKKALKNFKKSNSKYLLTTSYPLTWKNWDIFDGDYRPLNLNKKPFLLPKPLYKIREDSPLIEKDKDKYMFLYALKDILNDF